MARSELLAMEVIRVRGLTDKLGSRECKDLDRWWDSGICGSWLIDADTRR